MILYDSSIFFYSVIGGLLLLLLHVSMPGVIYDRLQSHYIVVGYLKYESKRQSFMSHYLAICWKC